MSAVLTASVLSAACGGAACTDVGEGTVHGLVARQARRTPDRVAVRAGERAVTYRELLDSVDRLAIRLSEIGVRRGDLVGVCLERGVGMVVGVLAVLQAGGAYVPLDPAFPAERLRSMVEDSAMGAIVTQEAIRSRLPEHRAVVVLVDQSGVPDSVGPLPGERPTASGRHARSADEPGYEPGRKAGGEDLAYVIFTSGSTGRPKGVRIRHRSVVRFLHSMQAEPGLDADDVLLAVTTLSFDIAGLELFLPLITGATTVVAPREVAADGFRLAAELQRSGATVMQATPVTWRMLLEAGWDGSARFKILIGGEAVPRDLVERLLPCCGSLWNMYGPTETTIWSTTGRLVSGSGPIDIGRPIAGTEVHVVDADLSPLPVGEVGELVIGGDGVADGYWNRPELTAERFLADRYSGRPSARVYRTGDLGRWRPDGRLECLGRIDDQVKIRGYRIELAEIESALRTDPRIRAAAVAAREDGAGGMRLVAYIVPGQPGWEPGAIRERMRASLPEYMLPSAWVVLDRLPLTPNGKLDRRALPAPEETRSPAASGVSPRTDAERRMVALWSEVLNVQLVGMTDNFFELGGHSLAAVRLFARVEKEFGRRLPLATLFRGPTPASLLAQLESGSGEDAGWASLVPIRSAGARPPLFLVHGAGGNILLYRDLAEALGPEVPVFGFQSRGIDGRDKPRVTIEEMAEAYVDELVAVFPRGPYLLGGYCMGGTVAFAMARRLSERGQRVALLALLDTYNFSVRRRFDSVPGRAFRIWEKVRFHASNVWRAGGRDRWRYLREKAGRALGDWRAEARHRRKARAGSGAIGEVLRSLERTNHEAAMEYRPEPSPVPMTVFKPERTYAAYPDPRMGWDGFAPAGLEIVPLPVNPHAMLARPFVGPLAEALRGRIEGAWSELGGRNSDGFVDGRTHRTEDR